MIGQEVIVQRIEIDLPDRGGSSVISPGIHVGGEAWHSGRDRASPNGFNWSHDVRQIGPQFRTPSRQHAARTKALLHVDPTNRTDFARLDSVMVSLRSAPDEPAESE